MSADTHKPAKSADFQRRQAEFAAHIRDPQSHPRPQDVEDRRMAIYRDLFYNNVEGFLASTFPVLRKLLADPHWHAMARDFFSRHASHSPLFLEIPKEFLVYLEKERGTPADDPAFLYELAHYEWVELALSVAEGEVDADGVDPQGDPLKEIPVLSKLAWPLSYHFPVHRIGPDFQPSEADENPTHLVVYRDRKDEVGFVELNPVSARLLGLLHDNPTASGEAQLLQIATELGHTDAKTVIDGGLEILRKWQNLDILAGTRNANPAPKASEDG